MRRAALLLVKAAISASLLYLALRSIHVGALTARLRETHLAWFAAAVVVIGMQVGLLGIRWRMVASPSTDRLDSRGAIQLSFVGVFFSQVLPSTVGGDAVRLWLLARRGAGWKAAAYSVLIDRVVGVAALAVIVLACLPWTLQFVQDPLARSMLVLIGAGALGASLAFLALGLRRWPLLQRFAATRHLAEAARVAVQLCRTPALASGIALSSFCIHALGIISAWACAQAISASVGVLDLLLVLPPVFLISTMPISIAGWGVRETSMITAFGYAGLAQGDGLVLSLLIGVVTFAIGAVGGIVWIAGGLRDMRLPPNTAPLPDQA